MKTLRALPRLLLYSVVDLCRDPRHPRRGSPLLIGLVSICLISVLFVASIGIPQLWYLLRTNEYSAEFANAGGLRAGDRVLVSGVPTGRVSGLRLSGRVALIDFRLDRGQQLGKDSTAIIGVSSLLGNRFLEITPGGSGDLGEDRTIRIDRTTSPYSLDELGGAVTNLAGDLDSKSVSQMLDRLNVLLPQDPESTGRSIDSVAAALRMLSGERGRIDEVVDTTRQLSGVLVSQEREITSLSRQAQLVVSVLAERRKLLGQLITAVDLLSTQARSLLTDQQEDVDRVLIDLRSISATYRKNAAVLDETFNRLPPALRGLTDALGNGPWVDVAMPSGPIPDSTLCALGVMAPCR